MKKYKVKFKRKALFFIYSTIAIARGHIYDTVCDYNLNLNLWAMSILGGLKWAMASESLKTTKTKNCEKDLPVI